MYLWKISITYCIVIILFGLVSSNSIDPVSLKFLQEDEEPLEKNIIDSYYEYEDAVSIPFCCGRHQYFHLEKFLCLNSTNLLEPNFHSIGGLEVEDEKVQFSSETNHMPECKSHVLRNEEFKLLRSGDLYQRPSNSHTSEQLIHPDNYCLIWTFENSTSHHMSAVVCFPETNFSDELYRTIIYHYLLPILMGISAFFLAATFIVYLMVKELQDLLGKALMCSVLTLCFAKTLSIIVNIISQSANGPSTICIVFGIAVHTGFLFCFFWLNVISFIVFLSTRCGKISILRSGKKWFLFSCIYAFGVPTIILILLLVHDFTQVLDNTVVPKPGLGDRGCGYSNRGANIIYFYAPMSVIVGINVLLFCFSACRLFSLAKMSSVHKFQFKHYLKLFLLMGLPWVFEVLSYFFDETHKLTNLTIIWLISDIFNGLQGLIIFLVLVWRPAVLARVSEKLFGSDYAQRKYPEVFQQHTCYEPGGDEENNFQLDSQCNENKIVENNGEAA